MRPLELLAPVGSKEAFYAAVENGADAVYLGGPSFNARMFADKFSFEDVEDMITYAHLRGVKVYITANTLIYEDEMNDFISYLDALYYLHADAIIIQDLGVLQRVYNRYPGMEIHASTQMNTHSVAQAQFLKNYNVDRIVVARETSIETIKAIKEETGIAIETFVHGALCVSYSGECLISSMIGKRSGNRGACAQTCRLPYTLTHDNTDLGPTGYYLSTKDLMAIEHIKTLIDNGVDSFKIEGRMKRAEYVAQTVKSYRYAIDQVVTTSKYTLDMQTLYEMKSLFNREFTKGYMMHESKINVLDSMRPNHRGTPVGVVSYVQQDAVYIALTDTVRMHDGLRIIGSEDVGVFVTYLEVNRNSVKEAHCGDVLKVYIDASDLNVGDEVRKTSDKQLLDALEKTYAKGQRKLHIEGRVEINNSSITLTLMRDKVSIHVTLDDVVLQAENAGTTRLRIEEQISKTGLSPFAFSKVTVNGLDNHFIAISSINALRRDALEQFEKAFLSARTPRKVAVINQPNTIHTPESKGLDIFVHTLEQLNAAIDTQVDRVIVKNHKALIARAQEAGINYVVSSGRINEASNYGYFPHYAEEVGALTTKQAPLSSPYLNVTNSDALYLLHSQGVASVALSYELSKRQIKEIIDGYETKYGHSSVSFMVYGRIDVMVMKSCPILPVIKSCAACKHTGYALRDRKDEAFPLYREDDCTIRVLNREIHELSYAKQELEALGVTRFMLQFIEEDYTQTRAIIEHVKYNLKGHVNVKNQHITRGYYE